MHKIYQPFIKNIHIWTIDTIHDGLEVKIKDTFEVPFFFMVISDQLFIRKHSYLDNLHHSFETLGSILQGGLSVQI